MDTILRIDTLALNWIYKTTRSSIGDAIMPMISFTGNLGGIWLLTFAFLYFSGISKACARTGMIALILSALLINLLLKNLFRRKRPFESCPKYNTIIDEPKDFSFPSGHTFSSFAAATVIFSYLPIAGIIAIAYATLIAFSRLYLCVHYVSDVVFSMALAVSLSILLLCFL